MTADSATMQIIEAALIESGADQSEVVVISERTRLTRFASSAIHQNLSEKKHRVTVRAVVGKRVGCATTNRLTADSIRSTAQKAAQLARLAEENPDFVSLPSPVPIPAARTHFEPTARCRPEDRAQAVKTIAAIAAESGCTASGSFLVTEVEVAVANSLGVRAHQSLTESALTVIASESGPGLSGYETATGYAHWAGRDLSALDVETIARKAVGKCVAGRKPIAVQPGDYAAILEPPAVAALLMFLCWIGFGATAVQEGRSFLCGRMGERVMHDSISIWDDGLDARGLVMPFDFEGVAKQRVDLIERGVAKGIVYDSYTAHKEGKKSTGHAFPAPNPYGPGPSNLVMATGSHSLQEMIATTERGLLVTRFHYVNVVHPKRTILTGMTRDGTFLVEAGKITRAVRNLRFTQNVVETLGEVDAVGSDAALHQAEGCYCPALKLPRFAFTSAA